MILLAAASTVGESLAVCRDIALDAIVLVVEVLLILSFILMLVAALLLLVLIAAVIFVSLFS